MKSGLVATVGPGPFTNQLGDYLMQFWQALFSNGAEEDMNVGMGMKVSSNLILIVLAVRGLHVILLGTE